MSQYRLSRAARVLVREVVSHPITENAPNNVTLMFEDLRTGTRNLNVEYIKPGRFSSLEMLNSYEDLILTLLNERALPKHYEMLAKKLVEEFGRVRLEERW